ncbi:DUF4147 domain-containing protein [Mesorhizobium sp. B2-4-19]|nr:DUF4147 domain-containing protein [Mesorhizobium sp. B2-4-19]
MTLADEIAVNEALLASGAPMNTIRKHVSTIKAGWRQPPGRPKWCCLRYSRRQSSAVASGPTVPYSGSRGVQCRRRSFRAWLDRQECQRPESDPR